MLLSINPGYLLSYERYIEAGHSPLNPDCSDLWKFKHWLKLEFGCELDQTEQFLVFDTIENYVAFKLKVF